MIHIDSKHVLCGTSYLQARKRLLRGSSAKETYISSPPHMRSRLLIRETWLIANMI